MNNFDQCVMAAGIGSLIAAAMLWGTGCASAPLDHDSIAPEIAPLFDRAKHAAVENYRRQWKAEPIVPYMIFEVVEKPRAGMAAWTTGNRSVVAREYVRLNVVTHEIGHQLKTRNGKGTGEDRL
jgi:hypothetical protein